MSVTKSTAIIGLWAISSACAFATVEHMFDTSDTARVKNEIVSMMLDESFTLTADTRYKLVFAKSVNLRTMHIEKKDYSTPGLLQVSFTVVAQPSKTRLSAFCVVNSEYSRDAAEKAQPKYEDWLNEFMRRLTAKIQAGVPRPSPSGTPP